MRKYVVDFGRTNALSVSLAGFYHRRQHRITMSKEPLRKSFPRVREVIKDGTPRYVCDSRSKIFAAGKQEWFSTKQDALNRAKEIEEAVSKGNTLTTDERTLFIRYRDAIALHGKSIEEVLEAALRRLSNKAIRDEDEKKTVSELVDLWIESKKKQEFTSIRPVTLREIEYTGKKIKELWGSLQYASIQKESVIQFLAAHKGAYTTKKNWKVRIGGFFNWCNAEGWGRGNPAKNISIEKTVPNPPEIIPLETVKKMLEIAQVSPRFRPLVNYLALGFFGGLRPFELTRLTWRYIDLKEKPVSTKWGESWGAIQIQTEMTKTKTPRFVPINSTLAAFLHAYKGEVIYPKKNFTRRFKALREAVGYGFKEGRTDENKWEPDSIRHTFASMWLPLYDSRNKLAEIMGNSTEVIRRHYLRHLQPEEASPYWEIRPIQLKQQSE